ncbi:MAG: hypothetical protein IH588_05055 [Anaerolineales bacterium]|nr:hypothetical protein [Anaerolineales bacterium]
MNTNQRPIFYKIRLRGKLDLEQATWFPELIQAEDDNGNTLLVGELSDQAALMGVLFRAHNLNLTILCAKMKFPRAYIERDKDEQAV